jgi:chaperonin GroES
MRIQAQHYRVIIKTLQENEQQYGSILLPDMGRERPVKGIVVDVGPGRTTESGYTVHPKCQVGDIVFIPQFGAQVVTDNNEEYYITRDSEILATYKETTNA